MVLSNTAVPVEYGRFRDAVLRGEIPVCREISMQMNRIDADIANPNYYYDPDAIQGFIDFCENEMTLVDGRPLTLLPTFRLWAEDLLAWFELKEEKVYDPQTGKFKKIRHKRRLRNKQYLIVARGNAKSLYATLHHAFGLVMDTNSTQQVTTAPTMAQAEEVLYPFATAITRAGSSNEGFPLFRVLTRGRNKARTQKSQSQLAVTKDGIVNRLTNSILEVKPMTVKKLQGSRAKYATVDEWLSGDIKEDVIGALEQSASKDGIDDYLILAVSSEGTVRDSVGDSIKRELLAILRGEYEDPHTSIWYYRLDDVAEVGNPDMWMKACPNIGITVSYEAYQRDVRRAEYSPANRNDILAKRFGIPVEGTTYFFTFEETELHRRQNFRRMEVSMGMDASQGDDFWAFTWLVPLGRGRYGVQTRSYVSEVKYLRLNSATQAKYDQLVAEGTLIIMPGNYLDWEMVYDDVERYIEEMEWTIVSFGYDPYNAAEFIDRWTMENGDVGVEVVRQGVRTESVPLGEIKNMATSRDLIFFEELMKYAMGNAVVIQDNNGNYKLSKMRSDEKIDNVAALMDAWVAYKRNKEAFL